MTNANPFGIPNLIRVPESQVRCEGCARLVPISESLSLPTPVGTWQGCMRCAGARLAAYGRLETQYAHALTLLARAYRMLTKPEGYREIGALADEIQHAL